MPDYSDRLTRTRDHIKRGQFDPVYVLLGDDGRAADELIRLLKRKLVAPGLEPFDLVECHAADLPVQQALQEMRQPPVGSARRLVVLRAADELRGPDFAALCAGLARLPPDGGIAVLVCRWSREMADAVTRAGMGRFVVNLKPPQGAELAARIRGWAVELGIDISPDGIKLLVELSGEDTTLLYGELEKLATALEPGTVVDAAAVRRLAGRSREFARKEYVDNLMRGNLDRALEVLARLAAWGEKPPQIIGWVAGSLLRRAEELTRAGEEDNEVPLKYLRRIMHQLYDINRAVLTGHPEPFLLLEALTVCACCAGRGELCRLGRQESAPAFCLRKPRWRPAGSSGRRTPAATTHEV